MTEVEALSRDEMERRFRLLHYKVQSQRLEKIWRQFEEAGFEPILIKGWAAAQLYDDPAKRQYTDVDLVVAPERFADAEKFLSENTTDVAVDLHCGVRHLDNLSFEDLYRNSVLRKCESTNIRVLREEDHLRVLCIHWLNDGGANKERLRDVYYGISNRSKDFDWHRFLELVGKRRRRWLVCAVGLTHRYLNLKVDDTPIAGEVANLPGWLIKAVEKEWKSSVPLIPLHHLLHDRQKLWQQVKKRIPPNPVQATIEMEGSFDSCPRFVYQIADVFLRLPASLRRNIKSRLG